MEPNFTMHHGCYTVSYGYYCSFYSVFLQCYRKCAKENLGQWLTMSPLNVAVWGEENHALKYLAISWNIYVRYLFHRLQFHHSLGYLEGPFQTTA